MPRRGSFDWLHINSATYVGPNHWFDEGDQRFAPSNVIISSRQASFLAIVARDGKIVWRLGPDFSESKELRAIRQIIGQHHAHIIPKGLPGAGNLLVFDNGGASGYGFTNPNAPEGSNSFARANSRVLEINPVTLELVWSYAGPRFYGSNISGAQRLPNGNTMITEGPNRAVIRSDERRQDRLGIHLSSIQWRTIDKHRLPGVSASVRLDSTNRAAQRATGRAAGAEQLQSAVDSGIIVARSMTAPTVSESVSEIDLQEK